MRRISSVLAVLCIIFLAVSISYAEQKIFNCAEKNVCGSWTPAMVGGPAAHGKDLLSVRWIEGPNMELTYNNQVILLSAYFDRGPDFDMLTVDPKDVNRADAIFLGHGHFDHMSDAAYIAEKTGAKIYAQAVTIDLLKTTNPKLLKNNQLVTVTAGEKPFSFNGFTVEAVHVYHSGKDKPNAGERQYDQVPLEVSTVFGWLKTLMAQDAADLPFDYITPPPPAGPGPVTKSQDQLTWEKENPYNRRDLGDKMVNDVMGYLFTFGKDFTFFYHDSMNYAITKQLKDMMARIKKTDIASVAYAGSPAQYAVPWGMPETKMLNPHYVIPNHHWPSHDMDVNPYAVAIRNAIPGASLLSLMPNQVSCFNVKNHKLISDGETESRHDK
jgi:L-ascorbate metabolism protein UlaG (beta-lactamase superfamily)